jgi:hypothetical protein
MFPYIEAQVSTHYWLISADLHTPDRSGKLCLTGLGITKVQKVVYFTQWLIITWQ